MITEHADQRDVGYHRYLYLTGYLAGSEHRFDVTPGELWKEAHEMAKLAYPDAPMPLSEAERSAFGQMVAEWGDWV